MSANIDYDDLITCPICFEQLTNPERLPCRHSFCHPCLKSYIITNKGGKGKTSRDFPCPVCRQMVTIGDIALSSEDIADYIPGNRMLSSLMDLSGSTDKVQKEKMCDPCARDSNEQAATHWCTYCSEALCQECTSFHKRLDLSKHKTILVGEMIEKKPTELLDADEPCVKHSGEILKVFCVDHKEMCCVLCLATSHRRCDNISTFDEMVNGSKNAEMFEHLNDKLNKICKNSDELINKTEENLSNLDTKLKEFTHLVSNTVQKAKDKLDLLQSRFEEKFQQKHKEESIKLIERKDRLEIFLSSVKKEQKLLQAVYDHGSPKQLFITKEKIKQQLKYKMKSLEEDLQDVKCVDCTMKLDDTVMSFVESVDCIAEVDMGSTSDLSANLKDIVNVLKELERDNINNIKVCTAAVPVTVLTYNFPVAAPLKATSGPFSETAALFSVTAAPLSVTSTPFSAAVAPLKATANPFTVSAAPAKATTAPFSVAAAPLKATAGPFAVAAAPAKATAAPFSVIAAPLKATSASFSVVAAPLKATSAPFTVVAAPLTATAAPFSLAAAPLRVTADPFTVAAAPLKATADHFTVAAAPLKATSAAFSLAAEPSKATSAPFSVAAAPFSLAPAHLKTTSAPSSVAAAPLKATADPFSLAAEPLKPTADPFSVAAAPLKATTDPFNLAADPFILAEEALKATSAPCSVTTAPLKATADPFSLASDPFGVAEAFKAISAPCSVTAAPLKATADPFSLAADPFSLAADSLKATSAPFSVAAAHLKTTSAPLSVTAAPLKATPDPFSLAAEPSKTTSAHFSVRAASFSLAAEPSKATAGPFSLAADPLKATSAPFNVTAVPLKAMLAPFSFGIAADPFSVAATPVQVASAPFTITKLKAHKVGKTDVHKHFPGGTYLKNGRMVFCNWYRRKLQVFNKSGNFLFATSHLHHQPLGVVCISNQEILVSFDDQTYIKKFEVTAINFVERKIIQCHKVPVGLAATKDRLIVGYKKRIDILSLDGTFIRTLSLRKSSAFSYVTVSMTSNLYYTDGDTVVCKSLDGREISRFQNPKLKCPYGISTDKNGNVYVCGHKSQNVCVFSQDGTEMKILITDIEDPYQIDLDPDRNRCFVTSSTKGAYLYTIDM